MINKTQLLVDLTYITKGMVTSARDEGWDFGSDRLDGDHVRRSLESLGPDAARKAKRKFRKLHRKIRKQKEQEAKQFLSRASWIFGGRRPPTRLHREAFVEAQLIKLNSNLGKRGSTPEIGHARHRRRWVYDLIHTEVWRTTDA